MKKLAIPILIFLVYLTAYVGFSGSHDENCLFLPVWDIKHYLDISLTGYEAYPCTPGVDGPPGAVCGNTGWFPMWPLVIKTVRPLFLGSSEYAFNYMPAIFLLLAFIFIYKFMFFFYDRTAAIITLIALAGNPAGFYWLSGFPYALLLFLFSVYIWLFYSERKSWHHPLLFLTALALSLTYPTGFMFGVIPLVHFWLERRKGSDKWPGLLLKLIPFALGPLLLFTYFYIVFDNFWLHLDFQAKYSRTLAFPFWIMAKSLLFKPILSAENITIIWYTLAFALFQPLRIKKGLWILGAVLFLFSLSTGTTMSIYRHYLLLIPFYMIIGISTRPLWLKIGFIAVGLTAALTVMLPLFMEYKLM